MKAVRHLIVAFITIAAATFVSCSDDDDNGLTVDVKVNNVAFDNGDDFNGDIDGDFTGNGGSITKTFNWNNDLRTADYNADITATAEGTFKMVVRDADGTIVLDKSLSGAAEPDSIDGVTAVGTSGLWTVEITLTSFSGDGSFSLSEGN